jgi:hypothetical protein
MEGRGKGDPLTERERAARHFGVDVAKVTPEMIQQLPPRGTGLEASAARGTDGQDIDMLAVFFLAHSMPHMETEASPGIVVDPDVAAATPCRCARADGSEICFSRGIIGGLDEGQKEAYCNPKVYFESPGLEKRIGEFKGAVAAAQERIKDVPKGERLVPWLSAMSGELKERGMEV